MSELPTEFRSRVLLTFQVALLGMVTPSLRAVTVGWEGRRITARCIYDRAIVNEDWETCSDLEGEVLASFPNQEVEVSPRYLERGRDLRSELLQAWVYRRKE